MTIAKRIGVWFIFCALLVSFMLPYSGQIASALSSDGYKLEANFAWRPIAENQDAVVANSAQACPAGVSSDSSINKITLAQFAPQPAAGSKDCSEIKCINNKTSLAKSAAFSLDPAAKSFTNAKQNDACINGGNHNAKLGYSISGTARITGNKDISEKYSAILTPERGAFVQMAGGGNNYLKYTLPNVILQRVDGNDQRCHMSLVITTYPNEPNKGKITASKADDDALTNENNGSNGGQCEGWMRETYNDQVISLKNPQNAPPAKSSTGTKNGSEGSVGTTTSVDFTPQQPGDLPPEDTDNEEAGDICDVQMNSPLSWILCPVLQTIELGVNKFFTAANDVLNFQIDENADSGKQLKEAWSSIRNIANILFVISFLFVIISQTLVGKL